MEGTSTVIITFNHTVWDNSSIREFQSHSVLHLDLVTAWILLALAAGGLALNALILLILRRDAQLHEKTFMTILLAALAVTDCLCLISLSLTTMVPIVVVLQWPGDATDRYIGILAYINFGMWFPSQLMESWLILALTVDRFLAVRHPFRHIRWCTARNALRFVTTICVTHVALYSGIVSLLVQLLKGQRAAGNALILTFYISFLFEFLGTLLLLIGVNVALMVALRQARRTHARLRAAHTSQNPGGDTRASAHIISVVVLFWITQAAWLWDKMTASENVVVLLIVILNSSSNFLLYCMFYRRFRQQTQNVFSCSRTTGSRSLSQSDGRQRTLTTSL